MNRDGERKFLVSLQFGHPRPALWDPRAVVLADTLPYFPLGLSPSTTANIKFYKKFVPKFSFWLFIQREEGPLRKEPPKVPPGHLGRPGARNQISGAVSRRLRTHTQ